MVVKFRFLGELNVKNPYLIVGFPGIAYVAKIAVDYLIEKLNAKLFAEVYSHHFPSFVIVRDNGVIEPLKIEVYSSSLNDKQIVLVTGNTQPITPEGQHELIDVLLGEITKRCIVRRIYAMAAYVVEKRIGEPKVYGVVTSSNLSNELKYYGVIPMSEGSISGANGIVLGYAKMMGIDGVCLLGETGSYTAYYGYVADVKASESLLKVLTRILGLEIDMTDIESRAREFEEVFKKIKDAEEKALRELYEKTWFKGPSYIR
ncbi:MAG: PAC2 family protein [Candidatus Methanomethylicia archaeon]